MAVATVDRLERETARKTIEDAHESFGLNYGDLASALDVTSRMLLRYRNEMNTPSPKVRDRMEALRQISHLLDEIFSERENGLRWLYTPVPLLQGRRPIDLMRRGELEEVLSVLAGHYSGAFVWDYEGRFGDTSRRELIPYTQVTSWERMVAGIGEVSMAVYIQHSLDEALEQSIWSIYG